jgi:hypothetical protein
MAIVTFTKFSPIDGDYSIYECVFDGVTIFDVSKNDAGVIEVAFHSGIANKVIDFAQVMKYLDEGRRLALLDEGAPGAF